MIPRPVIIPRSPIHVIIPPTVEVDISYIPFIIPWSLIILSYVRFIEVVWALILIPFIMPWSISPCAVIYCIYSAVEVTLTRSVSRLSTSVANYTFAFAFVWSLTFSFAFHSFEVLSFSFSFTLTSFSFHEVPVTKSFSFTFVLSFEVSFAFQCSYVHGRKSWIRRSQDVPAPEVLHQGVPHLIVSVDRGCIQTKVLLKCSWSLIHQSSYKYAIWNWSASLLFIFGLNSFPGIEVLFKSLGVELPLKNPSQKWHVSGSIGKWETLAQPTPSLKTISCFILANQKSSRSCTQIGKQIVKFPRKHSHVCCLIWRKCTSEVCI